MFGKVETETCNLAPPPNNFNSGSGKNTVTTDLAWQPRCRQQYHLHRNYVSIRMLLYVPDVAGAATADAALEYCENWMIDALDVAVFVVGAAEVVVDAAVVVVTLDYYQLDDSYRLGGLHDY